MSSRASWVGMCLASTRGYRGDTTLLQPAFFLEFSTLFEARTNALKVKLDQGVRVGD